MTSDRDENLNYTRPITSGPTGTRAACGQPRQNRQKNWRPNLFLTGLLVRHRPMAPLLRSVPQRCAQIRESREVSSV
jgi:hypothetical protein